MTLSVCLPWPPKLLWPNGSRGNHFAVSAAKKKYRHAAEWATIEARQSQTNLVYGDLIPIKLVVHAMPKGPLPDRDNCISALKVGLDSIAKQIGVNDRHFAAPTVEFALPRNGRIVVHVG